MGTIPDPVITGAWSRIAIDPDTLAARDPILRNPLPRRNFSISPIGKPSIIPEWRIRSVVLVISAPDIARPRRSVYRPRCRTGITHHLVRDARMFTIGGGTAQIFRTVVASRLLGRKLPQSRDGYVAMIRAG